jgi:hypothetical protein
MACTITSGQNPIPCKSISGINTVYLSAFNGTTLTYQYQSDGITIGTFSAGTASAYTFLQNPEVASFTAPVEVNQENNAYKRTQTLSFHVYNLTAANIDKIRAIDQGQWRAILLDNNGNYYIMGLVYPVQVSAGEAGLGKAATDLNGANITMTSISPSILTPISAYAASQVITA